MTLFIFIFIQEEHTTLMTEVSSFKKLDHLMQVIVFLLTKCILQVATKLIKSKASDACQDGMSDVRVDIVVGVVEFHVNNSNNKCLSTGHVA